jgi:hypothetical protein
MTGLGPVDCNARLADHEPMIRGAGDNSVSSPALV